jgi:signal peptidase I
LDLVETGRHYQCSIDVATGKATLSIAGLDGAPGEFSRDDGAEARPTVTGQTPIRGAGRHRLMLANVDDQLTLWVNGRTISFDGPTTYLDHGDHLPARTPEDDGDLAPAGIGSLGAALVVQRLKIYRDIYYIAAKSDDGNFGAFDGAGADVQTLARYLSDPGYRDEKLKDGLIRACQREEADFDLYADQFFTLGDNSPQSQDARIWGSKHYVTREFLIGKALFIYWPHAVGPIYVPNPFNRERLDWIPVTPNFKEMGFVR